MGIEAKAIAAAVALNVSLGDFCRQKAVLSVPYGRQIRAQTVRATWIFVLGDLSRETKSDVKTCKMAFLANVYGGFRECPRAESAVHHETVPVSTLEPSRVLLSPIQVGENLPRA